MKLIIDIDEEIYKSIKIGMRNRDDMAEIGEAVENGIPLDKIRAEIEALEEGITSYHNDRPWIFKDEVLAIFDKYKAESEGKE